jgi:hypothetical protein
MPIAVAASVSAARKPSNRNKKIPSKYLNLHLEKQKLEHELTTKFPRAEAIIFDKDLELLMMNGSISLTSLRVLMSLVLTHFTCFGTAGFGAGEGLFTPLTS